MTLRASVRRGGRYSGASDINLPTEFALRFEEPIAQAWGTEILKDIRRETKDYADDCVRIVEEVADWALGQGAHVQPALVEAQRYSSRRQKIAERGPGDGQGDARRGEGATRQCHRSSNQVGLEVNRQQREADVEDIEEFTDEGSRDWLSERGLRGY
jgi:hypothetical protein